jgi:hypothetical protein
MSPGSFSRPVLTSTLISTAMSFEYFQGVGMVHLQTVKKPRVVPAGERHRWLIKKLMRGQSTTCDKCGCVKKLTRDYETRFRPVGATLDTDIRPPCTGGQDSTLTKA